MIVVVDSSALITLARIGRLELLQRIVGEINVPDAVLDEVVQQGGERPGSQEVARAEWVRRQRVQDVASVERLRGRLGRGEAEAIVLARELGADLLIADDAAARQAAKLEGQTVVGLLGLLLHAKQDRLVSEVRPLLDEMRRAGFFLDDARYRAILDRAGESSA